MRVLYLIIITALLGLSAKSLLAGDKSIRGNYRDITAAIADLNVQGVGKSEADFNVPTSQMSQIGEFEGRTLALIDVGATGLFAPVQSCYVPPWPQDIAVNVYNYGLNSVDFTTRPLTITVLLTGAVTQTYTRTINYGFLASGASSYYVFGSVFMSTPGVYLFDSYTTLAGDTAISNNAMPQVTRVVRSYADLPDSIHFTGYDGNNLAALFPAWYEANGPTLPMDSTSLWKSQVDFGSPGNTSARVNLQSSGHNEWIVAPQFWATDSGEFKFDIAITAKDDISTPAVMGSDDTISVMFSWDCGGSWHPIRLFTAADLLSSTLTTETISLYTYRNSKLIIALKASDGVIDDPEDYDVHIDNIVLKSPFADVGLVSLTSPGTGCHSNSETVSVAIENFNTTSIVLYPIYLDIKVQVTGPITATFTRTLEGIELPSDQVINVDMPGSLNMSLPGVYKFNASIHLASDPDTSNNALPEVSRNVWSTMSLPLQNNFAGFDGNNLATAFPGWIEGTGSTNPSGSESLWTSCSDLGTVGNVSAKVRLSGNTTNEWIISPSVTTDAAIELKLKVALTEHGSLTNSAVMGSDDKVSVMISSDCGANWTSVKDFTAADALTPGITEFTIYNPSYSGKKILVGLRATGGLIDDPNDYDFHIDDIQLQAVPFALPVELLSFSGQRTGNTNLLRWSTASEQNVRGFQVERSADAAHFDPVAFVNSKANGGNSAVQLNYELADNNITGDKQYYRLKQYDFDGKNQLSNVILIRNTNPATFVLAGLFPNPVTNRLLVEIQAPYRDEIKITAVNNIGQVVKEKTAVVEKGVNTIDLDVQNLVPGIYILRVTTKVNRGTAAGKFLKL